MPQLRIRIIDSVAELLACRAAWDELWRRSNERSPLAACEPIACWLERFAADAEFRAIAVEDGERFAAALPLVRVAPKPWIKAGGMTGNDWSGCGSLLIDPLAMPQTSHASEICQALIRGMRQLPWPMLWFEETPLDAKSWQMLRDEATRRRIPWLQQEKYEVNRIDISAGWEAYEKHQLSKNARKQLRRDDRKLAERGQVGYQAYRFAAVDRQSELARALREALQVEHDGWKGSAGTSILATPGMLDFFLSSARAVADVGEVQVHLLTVNKRAIAFQLGYLSGGTFFVHKIGYHDDYKEFSPGHLLRQRVLQFLADECFTKTVDCLGPRNPASDRWATQTYRIGRTILVPHGVKGRMLLWGYKALRPGVRLLRSLTAKQTESAGAGSN